MAVKNLESLVLRGVAVLVGVRVVNLRLGTSADAALPAPVPVIPTRHPVPSCGSSGQAFGWRGLADYPRGEGASPGAGRPRSRAGVPSPVSCAATAPDTRPTFPWSCGSTDGGSRSAAVMSTAGIPAADVAPVAEDPAKPAQRRELLAVKGVSAGTRRTREG